MVGQYSRLGELLVQREIITNLQLQVALAAQQSCRKRLGDILVERGFASEIDIALALADQYGYAFVDAENLAPMPEALKVLRAEIALCHRVLPVKSNEDGLYCVICDPVDVFGTDIAAMFSGQRLQLAIATEHCLSNAIKKAYGLEDAPAPMVQNVQAPLRFADIRKRRQVGPTVQYDAVDLVLSRGVTLLAEASPDELLARTKKIAQLDSSTVPRVYDFMEFNGFGWAVLGRVDGENLGHALTVRGARSAAEAALIVARMAELSDAFQSHAGGCGLIGPDNVMITAHGSTLVPFVGRPTDECEEALEVSSLGALLRACLVGSASGPEADRLLDAAPPRMREVLERCNPSHYTAYAAPIQVAQVLASHSWQVEGHFAVHSNEDRSALLEKATYLVPEPQSFWAKLFKKSGQEAA